MSAAIFAGRKLAAEKEKFLEEEFANLREKGIIPKLVFILVGENSEAESYVRLKEKAAKRLGVNFEIKKFAEDQEEAIVSYINICYNDPKVTGITFEYPLPGDLEKTLPCFLPPGKDIDCLCPENLGRLVLGDYFVFPSTVWAILEVLSIAIGGAVRDTSLDSVKYSSSLRSELAFNLAREDHLTALRDFLRGKNVCLVGWGTLVGRPLALVLKNLGTTLTICDSKTKDLAAKTLSAQILISATGIAGLIKKEMVKPGAIVIDVGYPKPDVEVGVAEVASFLAPVPGGIGPVSITCLFENLLEFSLSNETKR
ncbi:bifunctional 5,10-methylenetetrahydrofolate dehydrogenase/5,10-methenyltetrahydrofolate cyclohydrolase [Candidatus Shapirobacteria bacterium]|nr:bifunctional 5,10-methylenetetrahydrofolate dehydrogenase/5,10-methenyltetrahydrofolate cyclohydrolase [Candidatus Shapirobacteria bacterium]